MILHDYLPSGNGYKARLLLAQLGIPFRRIEYDITRGETRTPEFLGGINPNGRVPVLELDDGESLAESDAILFYLADGTPLLPSGRLDRARVLQWMFFEQYSHEPNIAVARAWVHVFGLEMTGERLLALQTKRKLGHDALGVMEGHLADNGFFVGGRYTVADIALYAYTHVAHEGGFDLAGYPAVLAWIDRVAAQPGHIPIAQG
ncbi:MAG TPA: glutathione S-transferase family protein [Rubrobacter sp.]|nr:glutathione S-transferase family protein [Rubrobacter sp.]